MNKKAEMLGLEVVRQDDGFEDAPQGAKYPILGTDQHINLTRDQVGVLKDYGDLYDRIGNKLVLLDDNQLRIEKGRKMHGGADIRGAMFIFYNFVGPGKLLFLILYFCFKYSLQSSCLNPLTKNQPMFNSNHLFNIFNFFIIF